MGLSLTDRLRQLPPDQQQQYLDSLTDEEAHALLNSWQFIARPEQLPPEHGDWFLRLR